MQTQFIQKFIDQSIQSQLNTLLQKDQLFKYTDILIRVCQNIKNIFNNSKIAAYQFCQFIIHKLISNQLQLSPNLQHKFIQLLKQESKCTVYFTQISIRLFLLSYFCKQGEENKRKQWNKGLDLFINEARIEFMFNYNQSLATMLAQLISRIQQVCSELTFYQKLLAVFEKMDLDYVAKQIKQKMVKLKQNWNKQVSNNKLNFTPTTPTLKQKDDALKGTQKNKNSRKSIKIVAPQTKDQLQQDQQIRRRISDFREHQKRRLSQRALSGKKRTIFHQRKYVKKIDSQCQQIEQNQYFCVEQENNDRQQTRQQFSYSKQTIIKKQPNQANQLSKEKYTKQNQLRSKYTFTNPFLKQKKIDKSKEKQTDYDEYIMALGTPPKKSYRKNF